MCFVPSTLFGAVKKKSAPSRNPPKHPTQNRSQVAAAKRCRCQVQQPIKTWKRAVMHAFTKEGALTTVMPGSLRVLAQRVIIMCRRPHGVPSALACPRRRPVCWAEPSRAVAQVLLICADSWFALETTSAAALVPSSWENVENGVSLVCIIKRHHPRKELQPRGSCCSAGESVRRQVVG